MSLSNNFYVTLDNYIKAYLAKNQGVRLGESTVISHKVHSLDKDNPGKVLVLTDFDAGVHYLNLDEEGQVLHVDIYHDPARLDPVLIARHIWESLKAYLKKEYNYGVDLNFTDEILRNSMASLGKRIFLSTGDGAGSIYDLASRRIEKKKMKPQSHVHILTELPSGVGEIVPVLVECVESAILRQGTEIRRIEQLVNCDSHDETARGVKPLIMPKSHQGSEMEVYKQNRWQAIVNMVNFFGSVKEAVRFLESLTSKNIFLSGFSKKFDDIDQELQHLIERGIIKKGRIATKLTENGEELLSFMRLHQQELESQIRKAIRKVPAASKRYQTFRFSHLKSIKKCHLEKKKVIPQKENSWLGNLAIPETIVRSVSRNFLEGKRPLTKIQREDVKVYDTQAFAPIDTCLLVDCSGSMAGKKIRAVSYLAENLLLSTRERVGVVSFQEMSANVVSPFTKNYYQLQMGLRSIIPEGLTPLPKGIVESLNLIQNNKARNPMLVLITDGMPNFPLWTTDAVKDSLKAAQMVRDQKIRFVCIGIEAHKDFLTKLTETAGGNLHLINEFDKGILIDIVHNEWEYYKAQ